MSVMHDERPRPEGETTETAERRPYRVIAPLLTFDLNSEIAALRREDAWERGDHNANTFGKLRTARGPLVLTTARIRAGLRHPSGTSIT